MAKTKKDKKGLPPQSVFSRSKELLGLAAKFGQKEIGAKFQSMQAENPSLQKLQLQLEQAQLLVQALGTLKGAAMKAGQLICMEAADFLPPEVIEVLNQLQSQGSCMSHATVSEILERELGARAEEIHELSEKPLASASIGQVHRARVANQDVALKVQFPGIADSIHSDLFLLRKLADVFLKLSGRSIALDALFEEFEKTLGQEVDYLQEASFMNLYAQLLKDRPAYIVPRSLKEFSSARVLCMTLQEGQRLEDWLRTSPSADLRTYYARLFLDLYVAEFFESGLVQTDPNFANFLIKPESRQLVLLDFGATKKYSPQFRQDYKKLLQTLQQGDPAPILERAIAMELLAPQESAECQAVFLEMLRLSVEPFSSARQPFEFGDREYSREIRQISLKFIKLIRYSAPPHQILFLHRKLGGLFRLVQRLEVKIDLREYWENLLRV